MSVMVEAALSPSVGAVVRVWSLSGSSSAETTSRLAMVSFVDEEEGTCDVTDTDTSPIPIISVLTDISVAGRHRYRYRYITDTDNIGPHR
jgi:hypothetical protein